MAFVIGQASTIDVSGGGVSGWKGITSFSYNTGVSFNPLFQLTDSPSVGGSESVYAVDVSASPTISVSNYAGFGTSANSGHYTVTMPSPGTCTDSALTVNVTFTPGLCGTNFSGVFSLDGVDDYFITSYSFSKDAEGFGTESWSMQGRPAPAFLIPGSQPPSTFDSVMTVTPEEPSIDVVMVNGIATGTASGDFINSDIDGATDGVNLSFSRVMSYTNVAANKEVSVSAGNVSIGNATLTFNGFIEEFGGATLFRKDGTVVNVSVTVPMNPVYNPT